MRVKLKTDRATMLGYWREGQELDLDTGEAKRLIDAGQAEPIVARGPAREKATRPTGAEER